MATQRALVRSQENAVESEVVNEHGTFGYSTAKESDTLNLIGCSQRVGSSNKVKTTDQLTKVINDVAPTTIYAGHSSIFCTCCCFSIVYYRQRTWCGPLERISQWWHFFGSRRTTGQMEFGKCCLATRTDWLRAIHSDNPWWSCIRNLRRRVDERRMRGQLL